MSNIHKFLTFLTLTSPILVIFDILVHFNQKTVFVKF